jgi:predicted glycosyltransferase
LIYCQHVWGLGHLFRMREIANALAPHDVLLVTGGPPVELPLPVHVRRFELPALRMRADKQLVTVDGRPLDAVWAERGARLQNCLCRARPDALIVELYPFGRTAFGRELDPLLAGIRDGRLPRCRVYCSLRDILVAKRDPEAYENRVVRRLNRWFDALLVHADPDIVRLDATFGRMRAITIPVVYTGYVAETAAAGPNRDVLRRRRGVPDDAKLIVASAGGGQSGYPLLKAVLAAHRLLAARVGTRLAVFTGPYLPSEDLDRLKAMAGRRATVDRFTADFKDWLRAADLSVSMAGYNTCMNLLTAEVPALVWPFEGDREQPLRAARLAARGGVSVLTTADLEGATLARRMEAALTPAGRLRGAIDLDGAARTARLVAHPLAPGAGGAA